MLEARAMAIYIKLVSEKLRTLMLFALTIRHFEKTDLGCSSSVIGYGS
jgi:hypothetical protein